MRTYARTSGFTLVELLVVAAITGILLSVAIPSYLSAIERQKVKSAAESFVAHFYLAKSESLKSGQSVYYSVQSGDKACYGFRVGSACDCSVSPGAAQSCPIQRTTFAAKSEASLDSANFPDGSGVIEFVRGSATPGSLTWKSRNEDIVRAQVSLVGRVRLCSPTGAGHVSSYPSDNCGE